MKFIQVILIILFICASTDCNINYLDPKLINVKSTKYKINGTLSGVYIYKFIIDGHEYFLSTGEKIIHTANCTCHKEKQNNEYN